MANLLKQYSGKLSIQSIFEGIRAAQANANRLIADAESLIELERFPSANALAILAIEERGKVEILRVLTLVDEHTQIKDAWRRYRHHRSKNAAWIVPLLAAQGARTLDGFKLAFDAKADHAFMLDALKQISFYTDCLGDIHWSVPDMAIDKSLAQSMLDSAKHMIGGDVVTIRELELLSEIVKPHFGQPAMIEAMIRFNDQMLREGLSDRDPAGYASFIRGWSD